MGNYLVVRKNRRNSCFSLFTAVNPPDKFSSAEWQLGVGCGPLEALAPQAGIVLGDIVPLGRDDVQLVGLYLVCLGALIGRRYLKAAQVLAAMFRDEVAGDTSYD